MYQLYHLPLSPFSRKVRLVMAEKKIECELIEEKVWENRLDFLRLNPAGKVPTLKTKSITLGESSAICEYLEEIHPEPRLMPERAEDRAETRRLVSWFDDKFHHEVTENLLYERVNRKLMNRGSPDSNKIKLGAKNIKYHIDYMGWLLEGRRWLAGDQLTLADFTAAAQFSCLDYLNDIDWNRNSDVKNWYSTIKSRPAFRSILRDHIPSFIQPEHYADLDF